MKSERLRALSVSTPSELTLRGSSRFDHWALSRIQQAVSPATLRFVLWDGYATGPDDTPIATLTIKNRTALYRWLWNPDLNFGEGYMSGAVEVRGDLVQMLKAVYRAMGDSAPRPWWMPEPGNSVHASRENVHHHYDIGNEFYRLWLDRQMLYTCAYFPTPDATLEDAQIAKMALVARKLRLKPGERVVEAGCGWGSLALFMAREHGVRVTAFNISREQIAYAREQARAQGIADRVEFIEDDYRNVRGTCDAFVSVGMLEHVGLPDYATLGTVMDRVLKDDGRGLLHFIGRNKPAPLNPWITKRIFPGAYRRPWSRCSNASSSRPASRSSTSKTFGCITPRRSSTGARDSSARLIASPRCSTRPSCSMGSLPRRIGGRIHHRLAATVPGGLRPRRDQRDPLDAHE